jgi:hypothetical protein
MAEIIPFKKRRNNDKSAPPLLIPNPPLHDHQSMSDQELLEAALQIQSNIGPKYRFFVMQEGLPPDRHELIQAVSRLRCSLDSLAARHGVAALNNLDGVSVFFSADKPRWATSRLGVELHLPTDSTEPEIVAFIRERLRSQAS